MSDLAELLPELKNHPAILVTGPQRSGTTIAAHVLAQELGYECVEEEEIGTDDVGKARDVLQRDHVVLQAPSLAHVCHTFGCAVVFIRRPLDDIRASEQRVNWYWIEEKVQRYENYPELRGLHIAEIKYRAWDTVQSKLCSSFDLDYDSLQGHPLFVEQAQRQTFATRQWQL